MKRVNKEGPRLLGDLREVQRLSPVKETISNSFTNWTGWFLEYDKPFYVIADETQIKSIIKTFTQLELIR